MDEEMEFLTKAAEDQQKKNRREAWKISIIQFFMSIYNFFYLFLFSLISHEKKLTSEEINNANDNNSRGRRNINPIRSLRQGRYRSTGGG